jgi:callose synthase
MFLEYGMGFILNRQKYESADEWNNFLERMNRNSKELKNSEEELKLSEDSEEELRLWASYRGQTLTRTGTLFLPLSLSLMVDACLWFDLNYAGTSFPSLNCRDFDIVFLQLLVRGMMYYRRALELQAFLDMAQDEGTYSFFYSP